MTAWVIDASVAAKWLLPEDGSNQGSALLGDELLVPDLLFAALANIFWKKQMRGEIDTATADAAARWLRQAPLQVHPCAGLTAEAVDLGALLVLLGGRAAGERH
ncbi:MAG: hypothetical protein EBY24_20755 [Betaproteobacteria bacterium]|nr:hypothetical protein [Betaproteobacteria bacterium]